MRPGARIQSAIELLDQIEDREAPADRLVDGYFRRRRFAGSGDRAAITALVYLVLRHRAEFDWRLEQAAGGRTPEGAPARRRALAALVLLEGHGAPEVEALFDGGAYAPAILDAGERELLAYLAAAAGEGAEMPAWVRGNYPEWLAEELSARFGAALDDEAQALNQRAPVDLRVNRLKGEREAVLERLRQDGFEAEPCRLSPLGIRLGGRARVTARPLYRQGLVEVQDEGSQLVALLVGARPGEQVVDLCAGAGGKTLALAAEMANRGQVYACDVNAQRLARMAPRLQRAGVRNVQTRHLAGEGDPWLKAFDAKADRVLLDAPCSGSGAWRRNPDAKWRLTPGDLAIQHEAQGRLLARAARLVRPGGRLVYATCSLLRSENEAQVEAFLADHPAFAVVPVAEAWAESLGGDCPTDEATLMLTPGGHGVDGFFIAVLARGEGGAALTDI
jgi:16S rRNA (cytosine967-C5)-methyltransferase